jgi:hypothetical protein
MTVQEAIAQSLERQEPGTYDWTQWVDPLLDDLAAAGYQIVPRNVVCIDARIADRARAAMNSRRMSDLTDFWAEALRELDAAIAASEVCDVSPTL